MMGDFWNGKVSEMGIAVKAGSGLGGQLPLLGVV